MPTARPAARPRSLLWAARAPAARGAGPARGAGFHYRSVRTQEGSKRAPARPAPNSRNCSRDLQSVLAARAVGPLIALAVRAGSSWWRGRVAAAGRRDAALRSSTPSTRVPAAAVRAEPDEVHVDTELACAATAAAARFRAAISPQADGTGVLVDLCVAEPDCAAHRRLRGRELFAPGLLDQLSPSRSRRARPSFVEATQAPRTAAARGRGVYGEPHDHLRHRDAAALDSAATRLGADPSPAWIGLRWRFGVVVLLARDVRKRSAPSRARRRPRVSQGDGRSVVTGLRARTCSRTPT